MRSWWARPMADRAPLLDREDEAMLRAYIATAEACWRKENPSYSWHVLDWMSHRLSLRHPLVLTCDRIISEGPII
jgi:hypothetical protein